MTDPQPVPPTREQMIELLNRQIAGLKGTGPTWHFNPEKAIVILEAIRDLIQSSAPQSVEGFAGVPLNRQGVAGSPDAPKG